MILIVIFGMKLVDLNFNEKFVCRSYKNSIVYRRGLDTMMLIIIPFHHYCSVKTHFNDNISKKSVLFYNMMSQNIVIIIVNN